MVGIAVEVPVEAWEGMTGKGRYVKIYIATPM